MTLEGYRLRSPRVKIEILGGPAGVTGEMLERHLVSCKYNDEPGRHPTITMQFDNSDGQIFNLSVLLVGLHLRVRFGYENHISRPFKVPIKRIHALHLGEPARSVTSPHPDVYGVVAMEGHAYVHTLKFRPEDDIWAPETPMPLSRAVKQIARRYGYRESNIYVQEGTGVEGFPESAFDVSQIKAGECVGDFLTRKAHERGFVFRYTGKEFRWHRPDWKAKPTEVIEYFKGPDLLSYDIEGDYRVNLTAVAAKAIDPKWDENIAVQVGIGAAPSGVAMASPLRRQKGLPSNIQPTDIVTAVSKKAADAAVRRLLAHVANKWKLKLTLVGNPVIYAGSGLLLANFGPIVDGMWYVRGVEHRIDGDGYTTTLEARMKKITGGGPGLIFPAVQYNEMGQPTGVSAAISNYRSLTKKGYQKVRKKSKGRKKKDPKLKLTTKK